MRRKRILIADDDEAFLEALAIRLGKEDFEVAMAQDGYQALVQALERPLDLIILDINMPCGDGLSVQERLRKMARVSVPIIYITGEKSDRVHFLSHQRGAFAVFYKPLDTAKFMRTVKAALSAGRRRRPLPGEPTLNQSS